MRTPLFTHKKATKKISKKVNLNHDNAGVLYFVDHFPLNSYIQISFELHLQALHELFSLEGPEREKTSASSLTFQRCSLLP